MTTLLKLGGSVITEKDQPETVDEQALASAAKAIADAGLSNLVLVHGGGSFGHHFAERHGVSRTDGTNDPEAIRQIHAAMGRLNDAVIRALADRGVPAIPIRPLSASARDADGRLSLATDAVVTLLNEEFVPVLHGDVIAHAGVGATILSGDELVVALADALDADRIGLCAGVPGVLAPDGNVVPMITAYDEVADAIGESQGTDVTGGMGGKIRTLLHGTAPAWIFGLDGLGSFLAGGSPGTRIGD